MTDRFDPSRCLPSRPRHPTPFSLQRTKYRGESRDGHAGVCLERDAPLASVTRQTPVKIATRVIAQIDRLADLSKVALLCPPAANSRRRLPNLFDEHFYEIAGPYPRHARVTLHALLGRAPACVRNARCTTFCRLEIFFHISWT